MHEGYTLEQVVVMSRHNIRSPLSGKGSVLDTVTPHDWFDWSSDPSELSLRGGAAETIMVQYFRKWLEAEGLFLENYHPEEGAVRYWGHPFNRLKTDDNKISHLLYVALTSFLDHLTIVVTRELEDVYGKNYFDNFFKDII